MKALTALVWRLSWGLRSRRAKGLDVGSTLPDFELRDVGGKRHRLSTTRGKKVLWFTNLCEDCRSKAPLLDELARRGQDRVSVLAVSVLPIADPLPARFAPACAFPILLDPENVVEKRLGLAHPAGACPLHNLFIVDESGKVLFRGHLSALSEEKFRAACQRHAGL